MNTNQETSNLSKYNWLTHTAYLFFGLLAIVTVGKIIISENNIELSDSMNAFIQTQAQLIPMALTIIFVIAANIARHNKKLSNLTATTIITILTTIFAALPLLVLLVMGIVMISA